MVELAAEMAEIPKFETVLIVGLTAIAQLAPRIAEIIGLDLIAQTTLIAQMKEKTLKNWKKQICETPQHNENC